MNCTSKNRNNFDVDLARTLTNKNPDSVNACFFSGTTAVFQADVHLAEQWGFVQKAP